MKWSFATVGVVLLGIIGVSIIMLFQRVTTNNENDYYLLKEVTEAAMIDAIDISYYRETGDLKIVKEKFVENFIRRYAESTLFVSNKYIISFYNIMETPPKVSVVINTGLGEITVAGNTDDYNIKNKLDAILEYTGKSTYSTTFPGNPYNTNKTITKDYYAMSCVRTQNKFEESYSLNVPEDLKAPNIKNVKISGVDYLGSVTSQAELGEALLLNDISYNSIGDNLIAACKDKNVKVQSSEFYNYADYFGQNINDFVTSGSFNKNEIGVINCDGSNGSGEGYDCTLDKQHFLIIRGNLSNTDKKKAIVKYRVTWSYDEYEFS